MSMPIQKLSLVIFKKSSEPKIGHVKFIFDPWGQNLKNR